ncbi:hypothetical protein ARMGADRAFT_1029911 [Armillaria gallica]|uniref:Uncharacterized protein n=1 Tax=Armillaria gallica TaxID=47427 RepID=A0A2H3DFT3_ARMGA|nr:hypothetical protein ARMGADRAFT_1029911 [Armillaria gallica]
MARRSLEAQWEASQAVRNPAISGKKRATPMLNSTIISAMVACSLARRTIAGPKPPRICRIYPQSITSDIDDSEVIPPQSVHDLCSCEIGTEEIGHFRRLVRLREVDRFALQSSGVLKDSIHLGVGILYQGYQLSSLWEIQPNLLSYLDFSQQHLFRNKDNVPKKGERQDGVSDWADSRLEAADNQTTRLANLSRDVFSCLQGLDEDIDNV